MPTGLIGAAAKVSGPDLWAATVTAKAQIAASGGTATQPTQTQPGRHPGPAHHGPFGHAASCDGIRVTNDGIRVAGMVGEPAGLTPADEHELVQRAGSRWPAPTAATTPAKAGAHLGRQPGVHPGPRRAAVRLLAGG